jgi:hypothetical protein
VRAPARRDPGARECPGAADGQDGTGIGLLICRSIIDARGRNLGGCDRSPNHVRSLSARWLMIACVSPVTVLRIDANGSNCLTTAQYKPNTAPRMITPWL